MHLWWFRVYHNKHLPGRTRILLSFVPSLALLAWLRTAAMSANLFGARDVTAVSASWVVGVF